MKKMTNEETKKDNYKQQNKTQTNRTKWMTQTDLMRFSLLLKEYYDSTKRDVFAGGRGDKAHNSWLVYGVLGKHFFVVIKFSKP